MNVVCMYSVFLYILTYFWMTRLIIYIDIKKNHIFDSIPQFYTYVSIILNSLKIAMNFVKKYIDLQMMWAPRRHDSAAILVIYTKMRTTMCKRCRQPLLCTKLFRSLWRSKCTRFAVIQYKPHVAFYPRFSSLHDKNINNIMFLLKVGKISTKPKEGVLF